MKVESDIGVLQSPPPTAAWSDIRDGPELHHRHRTDDGDTEGYVVQRHHMVMRKPAMMIAKAMARFQAPILGIG